MGLAASRRALFVRGIVRHNGDETAFVFEEGFLTHARRGIPAILVATDRAIHVIESETHQSAVCSYNRIVRFDHREDGPDVLVGVSCYMGRVPTAQRIAAGTELLPSELANFLLRLPRSHRWAEVLDKIAAGVERSEIPPSAHHVESFI